MDTGLRPNLTRFPFVDKMAGPIRRGKASGRTKASRRAERHGVFRHRDAPLPSVSYELITPTPATPLTRQAADVGPRSFEKSPRTGFSVWRPRPFGPTSTRCRRSTQICDRFGFPTRVFLLSDGHRLVGESRRGASKPHRTFGGRNVPPPRHTSPVVFVGTRDTGRFMLSTRLAATVTPQSAAGCRRTGFSGWRPRPFGTQHSGRG